jgi:hypothetical protein
LRKGMWDMEPRVHRVAARQRARRTAGMVMARRRKTFMVPPYMFRGIASKTPKG